MLDLTKVLQHMKDLAYEVGALQSRHLGESNLKIHTKSNHLDLVTEIDQKSEQIIVSFLHKHYPDHGFLGEESGLSAQKSDYLWVVDPLDGTTNYAQGLPIFAVSIALQHQGSTLAGVVYAPMLDQMFTAIRGQGAYLNDEVLQVSQKSNLNQCVLATGFPYDRVTNPINNADYFRSMMLKVRAIRRMGAAAYDLACVAAGVFDGYWELNLKPWDVAAGILLVQEAGGLVQSFREDRNISIVAGSPEICPQILAELRQVDGLDA